MIFTVALIISDYSDYCKDASEWDVRCRRAIGVDHSILAIHMTKEDVRPKSGFRAPRYDRLFKNWRRMDAPARTATSVRQPRQESLWIHFER